jgi:hypothetical protein
LQSPVQQTCAPACVLSQALERQSASAEQPSPSMLLQAPRMNTSPGSAQTHDPSVPQTRPEAAQLGVQQRLVFVRSGEHRFVAH